MSFSAQFRSLACLVAFSLLCSSPLAAQEWTRFRGPEGSGTNAKIDIPGEWKENDLAWKLDLPGKGHSSPVLWGDKLFINSAIPDTGERVICGIDSAKGKILWTKKFPATANFRIHAQNSFSSGSPACDKDAVYFAWASPEKGELIALDHAGKVLWEAPLPGYTSRHGFGSSPIVYGNLVYLTYDQDGPSTVFAMDRKTGEKKWSVERKALSEQNASYATPMILPALGQQSECLIINSWAHGVSCMNPANGATIWEKAVFHRRPVGSPILHNGLIFGNCGDGGGDNAVVALRVNNHQPEVAFKIDKTMAPYVPSIIASGDYAYLWSDKGIVNCIHLPDGKKVWQQRIGGNFSSSPVIAGDKLINISAEGDVFVLATGGKFQQLGKNKLGETTRSTPALANGRMFIRTEGRLYAVKGK